MSVVITGLPARPAFVPAAPISSTSTVTDPAGGFLSALRAVQGDAGSDAGVKTLPGDAALAVSQFADAAFAGRRLGRADIAGARSSAQDVGTTSAEATSRSGASGKAIAGPAVSSAAVSSGAELPALKLPTSVGTALDPANAVADASRAVVSGLPAQKHESMPVGIEPARPSMRATAAPSATAAETLPAATPIATSRPSSDVTPAPAVASDTQPLAPVSAPADSRSDAFPSAAPASASGSSKDRARTLPKIVFGNDASTPVTAQPATALASNNPWTMVTQPSASPLRDAVAAGVETEHVADKANPGQWGTTADAPAPETPPPAPATQPSARIDAAMPAVPVNPPGAAQGAIQPADVPILQVKLRTEAPDTANAPDQAVTSQPLRAQEGNQHSASAGHGNGGQGPGQGQSGAPAADPSNTSAAPPVSAAPGIPAQAAISDIPLSGTTAPATTAAASPMAAPASDLVTSGAQTASPVSQVGSALLTLSTGSDGTQQMSLRLQPDELGAVEVRIERAPDGSARVNVTADNPNTLQMLSGAQDDLHKALDAAGIPAGRALSFALGTEARPVSGLADLAFRPVTEDRSASQQSSGGTPGQSGGMGGGHSQGGGNQGLAGGSTGSGGGTNTGSQGGGEAWANYVAGFQSGAETAESGGDSSTGLFQPEGI